jgi:hypothetical protein
LPILGPSKLECITMANTDFNTDDCSNIKAPSSGLALTGNIFVICAGVLLVASAIMNMYRTRKVA